MSKWTPSTGCSSSTLGASGAGVIVRGLRAISDFEYEMQMALMNRHLNPEVETVFMMPAEPYTYVSSRLVKEVVALGGSVTTLVPSHCRGSPAREEARARDLEGLNRWSSAARTGRIAVSPTMKVAADAMKLKAQGVDVVDFGAGEPDFPTPPHIARRGAPRHRRQLHEVHRPTPAPRISSAPSSSATRSTTASSTRRRK